MLQYDALLPSLFFFSFVVCVNFDRRIPWNIHSAIRLKLLRRKTKTPSLTRCRYWKYNINCENAKRNISNDVESFFLWIWRLKINLTTIERLIIKTLVMENYSALENFSFSISWWFNQIHMYTSLCYVITDTLRKIMQHDEYFVQRDRSIPNKN